MEKAYQSTRNAQIKASAKSAVLDGIAPDGGLYVWPELDQASIDMNQILNQNYLENAYTILHELMHDYTDEQLKSCIANAYTGTFASDKITPLKEVGDVQVLELFHGPTSAFKDVALTLLPQLMSEALKATNEKALILTATSGDTGKAALAGFKDVDNTGICVFYPDGKVSAMQYKQMASQQGKNVKVFGIEGNFDDAQTEVKNLFLDAELADFAADADVRLSSANSINIGRLVPQIVYYFDAYKQLVEAGKIKAGDKVSFSVPTGNFGDVLAGYYAYLMGLPVKKFYVASNANKVLTDFLTTGVYDKGRPFIQTISPSMDILVSSNLERLLYYMSGNDEAKVAGWMKELKENGRYEVDEATLKKIQELFGAGFYDDDATRKIIKEVYDKTGYVLDPHSAIGYGLAQEVVDNSENPEAPEVVVALATASPYKFCSDVLAALGIEEKDPWKALKKLAEINKDPVPANLAALEDAEVLHKDVLAVADMKPSVQKSIEELFA